MTTVVSKAVRLCKGLVMLDLEYRRFASATCSMFYRICYIPDNFLEVALLGVRVTARLTTLVVSAHSIYLDFHRTRTEQFIRSFVLACTQY